MVREIAVEAFPWREVVRSSSPEALERGKRLKEEIIAVPYRLYV